MTIYFIVALGGVIIGALTGATYLKSKSKSILSQQNNILENAEQRAKQLLTEAEEELTYTRNIIQDIEKDYTNLVPSLENRIQNKEVFLSKRDEKLESIQTKISQADQEINQSDQKYHQINSEIIDQLCEKTTLNLEEVKEEIQKDLQKEFQLHFSKESQTYLELLEDISIKKAQEDLKVVMQKYTEPSSTDRLDKFVELMSPKEALRIGGKDLENFEYIKEKLDVDIDIDEVEPNMLRVSGFILWKQEIAKSTIDKLAHLSHIDTAIIDKVIQQSTKEMDLHLQKIGQEIAQDIDIENKDPEFLKVLGRLQYRTSYGQNILFHSFEVGFFSQILANLLGEDPREAFLAGFFHDVGKALDQEKEGTHDLLGKEFLEAHGFDYQIYHPAHSHHYLVPVETTIGEIVIIADKISAGRPGARAESAEMYYERVKGLERIANEQEGVRKAYAISAGREIRTFIDENKFNDADMQKLAQKIAHQVEDELTYPGQIKVNIIRSLKSTDYANKK
jgi:ribonuclease Y